MKTARKIRKTISISEEVEELLKELSKAYHKPQSYIIEELIREVAREYKQEQKLMTFEELIKGAKIYSGKIGDKKVQEIKGEMGDEL